MAQASSHNPWLPAQVNTQSSVMRRAGIELELADITPENVIQCMTRLYGGKATHNHAFHYTISDTQLGDFTLELDAKLLQRIDLNFDPQYQFVSDQAMRWIQKAAQWIVPWEIVCPPIAFDRLENLNSLFDSLREQGAKGTHHATQFAFGLHINPELPNTDSETILRYLQAFLCLYDWIYAKEQIDLIRKVAPFIKHFPSRYILKVLSCDYSPKLEQLIDDYLLDNPTRNRTLDLLPLFKFLREDTINKALPNEKINARPTLHYRLPNCDIDNPNWNLLFPWSLWLQVEKLANDEALLNQFKRDYVKEISRLGHHTDSKWVAYCDEHLTQS